MHKWKTRLAWLADLTDPLPADLDSPSQIAAFETEHYYRRRPGHPRISLEKKTELK